MNELRFHWENDKAISALSVESWKMPDGPWEPALVDLSTLRATEQYTWAIDVDFQHGAVLHAKIQEVGNMEWSVWSIPRQIPEPDLILSFLCGITLAALLLKWRK